MPSLKTYDVKFSVPASLQIKVRAVDEREAKRLAKERLGGVLDMAEGHFKRITFGAKFTNIVVKMIKDPAQVAREYRARKRAERE